MLRVFRNRQTGDSAVLQLCTGCVDRSERTAAEGMVLGKEGANDRQLALVLQEDGSSKGGGGPSKSTVEIQVAPVEHGRGMKGKSGSSQRSLDAGRGQERSSPGHQKVGLVLHQEGAPSSG